MRRLECARRAKSGPEHGADTIIDAADNGFGGDGERVGVAGFRSGRRRETRRWRDGTRCRWAANVAWRMAAC